VTAAKTKICPGYIMDSSFGVLDAFAFLVFAVLLIAGVIIPGRGSAFQLNILNYVWSRWSGSRGDGEAT
jgi:hypothetical protein